MNQSTTKRSDARHMAQCGDKTRYYCRYSCQRKYSKEACISFHKIFCPENCKWLSLTEEAQNKLQESGKLERHFCLRYKVILYHGEFHPAILKYEKCKVRKFT